MELAFAAISLPAQIFSTCVLGYSTISNVRAAGRSANTQFILFTVQQTRFLVWGQSLDIYGQGILSDQVPDLVRETIISTLIQIRELLKDAERLSTRYGLQRLEDIRPVQRQVSAREIERQATLVNQIQKSCSLARRMRWAIYDQAQFANLLGQLKTLNDALYQFCPISQRPSLAIAIDAETLARTVIDEGTEGVRSMQIAATQAEGSSLQNVRDITTAYLAGREREAAESHLSAHSPLDKSLIIAVHQLRYLSHLQNDTPQRRSWAQLLANNRNGGFPCNTLVEWRPFNPIHVTGPRKFSLEYRIEALVKMLQREPRPRRFRVLDCVGYLEDNVDSRFGLVYRFPRGCEQQPSPVPQTLFQCMSSGNPVSYLEQRFELAAFLAESLYEFLSSGWFHKSINSHNVLFFSPAGNLQAQPSPISLKDPYFTGFALSCPDDLSVSAEGVVETEVGIYRHPDVQGLADATSPSFHALYDIYSLGTVLLEIGIWMKLRRLYEGGTSGFAFRDRLVNRFVPQLGASMGERYMTAVRKCLTGQFDGVQKFLAHERQTPDYILNLQRSFYWEVVKVLRDCRV